MRYARTVLAYHGCDLGVAHQLLNGAPFKPSVNDYDWLGEGVYFWEYGPDRAYQFAQDQVTRGKVTTPAIIGAYIQLGDCFDLLDTRFTKDVAEAYTTWEAAIEAANVPMPVNSGASPDRKLRKKDCAVLNWYLKLQEQEGKRYQTVRACFTEGAPVFADAGLQMQSHIQIAVRDATCILGVFRPTM